MSKSKHIKLLPKAIEDISEINKDKKKNAVYLKKLKDHCDGTVAIADACTKNTETQYRFLQGVVDRYSRKVIEIETEEKKSSPDKRVLAKLEKEADKIRKEYNDGIRMLADLTAAVDEQMAKLRSTANNNGFVRFFSR